MSRHQLCRLILCLGCGAGRDRDAPAVGEQEFAACAGAPRLPAIEYSVSPDYLDERRALAAMGGRVTRDSLTLRLSFTDGRVAEFRDCLAEGDATSMYEFMGLGPHGSGYLVRATYYESSGVLWVSAASGARSFLANEPVFSPDSTHFAIANADLEARYTENLFAIWRIEADSVVEVLRVAPGDSWGAAHPVWESNTEVSFERLVLSSQRHEERVAPGGARLVGKVWRYDGPAP